MTTLTLHIPHATIKAALIVAPKMDVRNYLNGAALDLTDGTKPRLVVTDGHRMLVINAEPFIRDDDGNYPGLPPEMIGQTYILPRDLLAAVKPAKVGKVELPLAVTIHHADGKPAGLTVQGATTAQGSCIDGKYPEWRRVWPQSLSGEAMQYNPDYLADFKAIAALLIDKKGAQIVVGYNGHGPALIDFGLDTAAGVVMPQRLDPPTLPTWI